MAEVVEVVLARRALLDVLETLHDHTEALILVGAQAVYLHAPGGLAVPAFTTDADVALNPDILATAPDIEATLTTAGYRLSQNPGSWESPLGVHIDLMTSPTRPGAHRAALLHGHGRFTARQTLGLEVALVDHAPMVISSLDPSDPREVRLHVASPPALVVAKLAKIQERVTDGKSHRIIAKDAGDLLRLLRIAGASDIGVRLQQLSRDPALRAAIEPRLDWLADDLRSRNSSLVGMVIDAAQGTEGDASLREAVTLLGSQLLTRFREIP